MNESLTLKRRLRPKRVLPELLSSLQRKIMFWRAIPSLQWDWITLLLLAGLIYTITLLFTGKTSALLWFALGLFGVDLHNNALPIFARVRIRGDKITVGTIFTERHSLAEIERYRTSQDGLPEHSIRFYLSEKYWPDRIALVVDEEDAATLSAHLEARGIDGVAASSEQVALEV